MQEAAQGIAGLIGRAKAYDREAFTELYRLTFTPVYRYLSARLDTVEEAEDLTQEVFMAALSGIQGLRAADQTGLLAWLFQIARHKIADYLRQRIRRPSAPLEETDKIEATSPSPQELAEAEQERKELRQAVEQLTPEQREVILCKYVLGYDNQQTAGLMGKNINSVNQLQHRALASLSRLLKRTESQ
ncbi:MAG: sigma-70 family RNA polymerase sigma factor [Chloroflexi bacterium]|nr:sigma-70 family RNA polymerase sigma factor [Chloroflexota bacterium]